MKNTFLFVFLLFGLSSLYAQDSLDAETMVQKALTEAKNSGKKVMVKYTATWCGWCHKMDTAMADASIAKFFDNNYIVVRIHILESESKKHLNTKGGEELYKLHAGDKKDGIPFWVILNVNNKVIANSRAKAQGLPLDGDGENVGCPAQEAEVDYFLRVLKTTGKFGTTSLRLIKNRFRAIVAK